jgi:hypothetical protein
MASFGALPRATITYTRVFSVFIELRLGDLDSIWTPRALVCRFGLPRGLHRTPAEGRCGGLRFAGPIGRKFLTKDK